MADITVSNWLNGDRYPLAQTMKKIEHTIGWKAVDQIQLIPMEGMDLAYGIGLRRALNKYWGEV